MDSIISRGYFVRNMSQSSIRDRKNRVVISINLASLHVQMSFVLIYSSDLNVHSSASFIFFYFPKGIFFSDSFEIHAYNGNYMSKLYFCVVFRMLPFDMINYQESFEYIVVL